MGPAIKAQGEIKQFTFEIYASRAPLSVAEQALWGLRRDDRCDSRISPAISSWHCTLVAGHPGAHVGGFDQTATGARWWESDTLHDLDCGPDKGE